MPAHLSDAQNVQASLRRSSVVLEDGRTLSRHMVRANGFVDGHAKVAANTFRPLPCDLQLVRDEAARLKDVAGWIGIITALANHHPAPGEVPPGSTQMFLRDTEAARPLRGRTKRVKAVTAVLSSAVSASVSSPPCTAEEEALPAPSAFSNARPNSLPRCGEDVRRSRAYGKAKAQVRAAEDGEALRLQDWLEQRLATRAPPTSASQREVALRNRLAVKQRPCGCLCFGPPCACA